MTGYDPGMFSDDLPPLTLPPGYSEPPLPDPEPPSRGPIRCHKEISQVRTGPDTWQHRMCNRPAGHSGRHSVRSSK